MRFLNELQLSFRFYSRALRFVEEHGLWSVFLLPALLQLIAAIAVAYAAWSTSGYLVDWVFIQIQGADDTNSFGSVLKGILLIIIHGSVIFLYIKAFRYIVLILYAPIMVRISNKVQSAATGREPGACSGRYWYGCSRGARIASKNLVLELLVTLGIAFLTMLIIWIAPLAPLFILIAESYFFGYSIIDYRNEYFEMSRAESRQLISEHPGLVLGNGILFNVLLLIPLFGVLFAPPLALIAGGLSMNYLEKRKSLLCSSDPSTLIAAKY